MADSIDYTLGASWAVDSPITYPSWQRVVYDDMLLETARTDLIIAPYARIVSDFNARKTKQIIWSEVLDMEPNWNPTTEQTIWFKGGTLDSRTLTISLALYHKQHCGLVQ